MSSPRRSSAASRPTTRSRRRLAFVAAAFALFLLAPAGAHAQAPSCAGQQRFVGNNPGNNVQIFFNCNRTIRSFRVSTSKSIAPGSITPAAVERNGTSQPPPQGFLCSPNGSFPRSFTCGGQANSGNLVRDNFATQTNPCGGTALRTTVTVGTGMPDASGNPTGRRTTFSLGALRGCRVAIARRAVCAGEQVFVGNNPGNNVQILFNCNRTIRSFRVSTSKPIAPGSITPAAVERNGTSQPPPQGFLCSPNGSFPRSFTCGGQANSGNLVRDNFATQTNPCGGTALRTTVTVGTGMPDASGNPTGTRTTFSLGALQGCRVTIAASRRPAPRPRFTG